MNFYLLKRKNDYGYDQNYAMVVFAKDEQHARHVVASQWENGTDMTGSYVSGDEGMESWMDPSISTCEKIDSLLPRVVLAAFNAG